MRFLSGQWNFRVACWFHVTVPDQPHIAGRGGGCAHSVDPVSGAVRQSVRPGPADLRGVLVRRRARAPSTCRLHEGARRLGPEGSGHRPSAAEGLGGGAPAAPAQHRCPRARRSSSASPRGYGIWGSLPSRTRRTGVLWNTLIAREHPHGMTTFAGCQVRYLVGSAHGWLGAAGFAAAALRAAARDRWIGWDDAGRRGHLQRVVCLSRS